LWLRLNVRVALGFAEPGFPLAQNAGYRAGNREQVSGLDAARYAPWELVEPVLTKLARRRGFSMAAAPASSPE